MRIGILALLVMLGISLAGEKAEIKLLQEDQQIRQKVTAQEKTPQVQEYIQAQKALEESRSQHNKEIHPLFVRRNKATESPVVQEYFRLRFAAESELHALWEKERADYEKEVEEIYRTRQKELSEKAQRRLPEAAKLGFDIRTFPLLGGSYATRPLSLIIASRFLNASYRWNRVETKHYPHLRPNWEIFCPWGYKHPRDCREINFSTISIQAQLTNMISDRVVTVIDNLLVTNLSTDQAYKALLKNRVDLIFVTAKPSSEILTLSKKEGKPLKLVPVARDALVMVVNRANPAESITLKQIKDIYSGKPQKWPKRPDGNVVKRAGLGEVVKERVKGSAIKPYVQNENGLLRLFSEKVMSLDDFDDGRKYDPMYTYNDFDSDSIRAHVNNLLKDVNGIGFTTWYYDHYLSGCPLTKTLEVNGVKPNAQTIASGEYPLTCDVYAVVLEGHSPYSPAEKLLNWLLGKEGQVVIRESGYIPLSK